MAATAALDRGVLLTRSLTLTASLLAAALGFIVFLQFGASDGFDAFDVLRAVLIFASTFWLAWGAAQATAAGLSIAVGGGLRDVMGSYAMSGQFGQVMASPTFGYAFVYQIEIVLLFVTLIALGPLVRVMPYTPKPQSAAAPLGIVDFPT